MGSLHNYIIYIFQRIYSVGQFQNQLHSLLN
uniref:Uncharacterized protein n=1 Tax=Arcella intermedia TaxID=1963864 RepID=A0A6B2LSN5_9EUKA